MRLIATVQPVDRCGDSGLEQATVAIGPLSVMPLSSRMVLLDRLLEALVHEEFFFFVALVGPKRPMGQGNELATLARTTPTARRSWRALPIVLEDRPRGLDAAQVPSVTSHFHRGYRGRGTTAWTAGVVDNITPKLH